MWSETITVYLGLNADGSSAQIVQIDESNQYIFPEYSAMRHANDIGK